MVQIASPTAGLQRFDRDRLKAYLAARSADLSRHVEPERVVRDVADGACDGMTSDELLQLVARLAASRAHEHPDYTSLAGRVELRRLQHGVPREMSANVERLVAHAPGGRAAPLVSDEFASFVREHAARIDAALRHERDDAFDYFAVRTLARGYLLRDSDGRVVERPQHMYMRVALAVHAPRLDDALRAYDDLSQQLYSHASPTVFHAGTGVQQLSSCFLLGMREDSVNGIYDTVKQCAQISKTAGGIGLSVSNVRAEGSYIVGTQGKSNGLVPMLRVLNATARYIDQGGGRRRGAFAVYIEPWHADVRQVLDMKRNQGAEELRARDLFYALWVPDLFMERVAADAGWSLMCPSECPGLDDVHGEAFAELYARYEREGRARETIRARDLWTQIIESQLETGGPYMLYKDACNRKSNHRGLGTIKCSNLCTEVVQYTSEDEIAVCNLGSLCLPRFVRGRGRGGSVDMEALHAAAQRLTVALDRVIDINAYPLPQARTSNRRHRPIGIGVQGLADVFAMLALPYDGPRAAELNEEIFETVHHGALTASAALARELGPYPSYRGSPASEGVLQCDMWGKAPRFRDWAPLRAAVGAHGLRNSLLTAPMPTASTAQIAGNTESFEPRTSNAYVRRVLSGEFMVINRHLVCALDERGLWPALRVPLLRAGGSVQGLDDVPQDVRDVFKTAWEMKSKPLVDMAVGRAPYIDQSQSFNMFMQNPTGDRISKAHMYAWRQGLKTGMYYLHTRAAWKRCSLRCSRAASFQEWWRACQAQADAGEEEEEGARRGA